MTVLPIDVKSSAGFGGAFGVTARAVVLELMQGVTRGAVAIACKKLRRFMTGLYQRLRSRNDRGDGLDRLNADESLIEAVVKEAEPVGVYTHLMEYGGVQLLYVALVHRRLHA